MTVDLNSFRADCRVAVVGASGGIGTAVTRLLAASPRVSRVYALSRSPTLVAADKLQGVSVDVDDEQSIRNAAEAVRSEGKLDLVFVATGILHDGDAIQPEKRISELQPDVLQRVLYVNAVAPALVAKHFLPALRSRTRSVFAALSARVGSISDNRLGGWASYRTSKAALNMLLRTFAIEHARSRPQSIIAALHPGTVATSLSAPFQARVPERQLFSPETSAAHLLNVINGLQPEDSGGFFAWDGSRIEY